VGASRFAPLAQVALAGERHQKIDACRILKKREKIPLKETTMEIKPDTIHITANAKVEIHAKRADLFIAVRGSSVVSGNEAMKKAKEVSALVDELTSAGIKAENIHLEGVVVEASSGVLLKSSSATYRLRVRCEDLEKLPEALDIVSAQKNAALERVVWKYNEDGARGRGLESAIAAAKSKAQKVAESLGVKLLGVYSFNENAFDEESPMPFQPQTRMMKARQVGAESEPSLAMDIQHSKIIQVNVEIEYRVAGF
jgi:uncharacterized protein YggE